MTNLSVRGEAGWASEPESVPEPCVRCCDAEKTGLENEVAQLRGDLHRTRVELAHAWAVYGDLLDSLGGKA